MSYSIPNSNVYTNIINQIFENKNGDKTKAFYNLIAITSSLPKEIESLIDDILADFTPINTLTILIRSEKEEEGAIAWRIIIDSETISYNLEKYNINFKAETWRTKEGLFETTINSQSIKNLIEHINK